MDYNQNYNPLTSNMIPQTQKQWVVRGDSGFDSLEFQTEAPVPSIGDRDVLVQSMDTKISPAYYSSQRLINVPLVHAVSLNFRDLLITKVRFLIRLAPISASRGFSSLSHFPTMDIWTVYMPVPLFTPTAQPSFLLSSSVDDIYR